MKATKEQLKARAAKVLDEYQKLTNNALNETQYGYLCTAMAGEMCSVIIEALESVKTGAA